MSTTFELRQAINHAWQRVNSLANLYETKGSTLRPDGTYPSQAELEPLRTQMLQAVEEAETLEIQLTTMLVDELFSVQPDAHLEAAYEDRVSGWED